MFFMSAKSMSGTPKPYSRKDYAIGFGINLVVFGLGALIALMSK